MPSVLIYIPIHNRLAIARECVPTVRDGMHPRDDILAGCDDGSTERFTAELASEFDRFHIDNPAIGIEAQRRSHFMVASRLMLDVTGPTHLYLTDADAIHDPNWRSELLRIQDSLGGMPVCGYNTRAHSDLIGNTLDESHPEVVIRRFAPGISYLLTREHVEKVVKWLEANPEKLHWSFDWQVPSILGGRFAVTKTSYVDHIGYGGYHHPPDAGWDGGDRATAPTKWLVEKRAEIVGRLKG
jgi:hypothetical protein